MDPVNRAMLDGQSSKIRPRVDGGPESIENGLMTYNPLVFSILFLPSQPKCLE